MLVSVLRNSVHMPCEDRMLDAGVEPATSGYPGRRTGAVPTWRGCTGGCHFHASGKLYTVRLRRPKIQRQWLHRRRSLSVMSCRPAEHRCP